MSSNPSEDQRSNPADTRSPVAQSDASAQPAQKGGKMRLVMFAVVAYLIFTNVGVPLYNRLLAPVDPSLPVLTNGLQKDAPYTVEVALERRGKPVGSVRFDPQVYSWDRSQTVEKSLAVPTDFAASISDFRLRATLKYRSACRDRNETVSCAVPLSQILPERLHQDKSYVDGVVPKDSVGNKTSHVLSRVHLGVIYDPNNRTFGTNPMIDYIYSSTNDAASLARSRPCFHPALDCSNFWTLRRDKVPTRRFNESSLHVGLYTVWSYQYEWVKHFELLERTPTPALDVSAVLEDVKELFSDNSYAYLTLLFVVNGLHTLFFALGLSSSYAFWSSLSSSAGLSPGKYYSDVLYQLIVLLYMIDNDTSLLLVVLSGFELLMSLYIAIKITGLSVMITSTFPFIRFVSKAQDRETAMYERTAVRFLTKVATPFLLAYAIYSFTQRGPLRLYSFVLKTLVTFIYVFGFINMTPQVYINYKLQSVERMPWKTMTYHFLNTIIDDLFAFAIKMTTLQRVSVFRDDVIFIIFLIQMWMYRHNRRPDSAKEKTD